MLHKLSSHKRIAIIGWGAAWLMVAATLIEKWSSDEVHIFEKNNELWMKIRISGWWRCNVTTWFFKKQDLQYKYTRGRDFLSHAMGQFWPRKMLQRCESHGVPLKCEADMRVFPQSNKSTDIVNIFQKIIASESCIVHFEEWVQSIEKKTSNEVLQNNIDTTNKENQTFILTTNKETYEFNYVVITTGGNAYAHTGSSWDGYSLAQSLWHTLTPLWPSLNSFLVQEDWIKKCSGLSFQNAKLTPAKQPIMPDKSDQLIIKWPLLCTHFGISWPVTFSYSSHIPYITINEQQHHIVLFQPFADRNEEWWNNWLTKNALEQSKKQLHTILHEEFTDRRIESFLDHHNFQWSISIGNFPREDKKALAKLLGHGIPLTLTARRPWDEFVTAWWVNTAEVNPKTMESKICSWLYFAGEVLNIDAVTGGFNFQACWATGRCAWENI